MIARRRLGIVLQLAGALLLVHAASRALHAALLRDRARATWDAAQAHRAVLEIAASLDRHRSARPPAPGEPVGRLLIPRLGLDEVVVEGIGNAQLDAGPGHLPGSAAPGEKGNAIISAHRDRHFHGLDALVAGDTVITESMGGRITWVVTARRMVERDAPALFATSGPVLTLTTCWPVRWLGPAPDRLLVTATPLAGALPGTRVPGA